MNNASMILRILAILGAAAAAVMFYIIGDTKDQLQAELQTTKNELTQTKGRLSTTENEREELQGEVASLTENLEEAQARASSLDNQLTQVRKELADANKAISDQENQAATLRSEAAQIRRQLLEERTKVTELEQALEGSEDAEILQTSIQQLEQQLLETERRLSEVGGQTEARPGDPNGNEARSQLVRGEIIEVGPKASYVLINRGSNEGVRQNSSVMIRRGPRYVARANITEVHDDISVAEVQAGGDRIRPGDLATTLN